MSRANLLPVALLKLPQKEEDKDCALYLERYYHGIGCPQAYEQACKQAIVDIAREAADRMKSDLLSKEGQYPAINESPYSGSDLSFLGADITCEYSDANRGIQPECRYTIARLDREGRELVSLRAIQERDGEKSPTE